MIIRPMVIPSETDPAAGRRLPPTTALGAVRLTAGDAQSLAGFYEQTVGLSRLNAPPGLVALGAGRDGSPLVELVADPGAPARPTGTTGLFHLAILVPSRLELARALRRVSDSGWRFTGASDHLVSEALYLRDPEGNGIEIYRDRDRDEWGRAGDEIAMDTLPLDLEAVLSELTGDDAPPAGMPPQTKVGHVHLNVADIPAAEAFYRDGLGFDVTVRSYPGALFVSAGGYHHHVGLNTWMGAGAPAPPPGARGLQRFEIVLPTAADLDAAERRLVAHGFDVDRTGEGVTTSDPSGNRLLLAPAANA
jgi:catechol 2,3-dioxygenase